MKLWHIGAAVLFAQASLANPAMCLRSDRLDQIKMTGPATAVVTDREHYTFDITFVGSCGAHRLNEFFIIRPESMPACVSPGTAFPTHTAGVCVVKTIVARQ